MKVISSFIGEARKNLANKDTEKVEICVCEKDLCDKTDISTDGIELAVTSAVIAAVAF